MDPLLGLGRGVSCRKKGGVPGKLILGGPGPALVSGCRCIGVGREVVPGSGRMCPGLAHYWEEVRMQQEWEGSRRLSVFSLGTTFPGCFPARNPHRRHLRKAGRGFVLTSQTAQLEPPPHRPLPAQVSSVGPEQLENLPRSHT